MDKSALGQQFLDQLAELNNQHTKLDEAMERLELEFFKEFDSALIGTIKDQLESRLGVHLELDKDDLSSRMCVLRRVGDKRPGEISSAEFYPNRGEFVLTTYNFRRASNGNIEEDELICAEEIIAPEFWTSSYAKEVALKISNEIILKALEARESAPESEQDWENARLAHEVFAQHGVDFDLNFRGVLEPLEGTPRIDMEDILSENEPEVLANMRKVVEAWTDVRFRLHCGEDEN